MERNCVEICHFGKGDVWFLICVLQFVRVRSFKPYKLKDFECFL